MVRCLLFGKVELPRRVYLGTGNWFFELKSVFFRLVCALRSVLSCLDTGGVLLVLCTIVGFVGNVPRDSDLSSAYYTKHSIDT